MPKDGKHKHKLHNLEKAMERRNEKCWTLSEKTGLGVFYIEDLRRPLHHRATDEELTLLANALACRPEQLTGEKPLDPVVCRSQGKRGRGMSISEDNLGGYIPEYNW